MHSTAASSENYLAGLPEDHRQMIGKVRHNVLEALPDGYVEAMNCWMICEEAPLELVTKRWNSFVALSVCFVAYSCPKTATHFSGIRLALVTKRWVRFAALSLCLCVSFSQNRYPLLGDTL